MNIAILASTNLDLLPQFIGPHLAGDASFYVSPFGQYRQDVLDPQSALYAFAPDHVVVLLEGTDVLADVVRRPLDVDGAVAQAVIDRELGELSILLDRLGERLPAAAIFVASVAAPAHTGLGLLEGNHGRSIHAAFDGFNAGLRALAQRRPRRFVLDYAGLVAWHGARAWYDERMWVLGRIRLSRLALDALGQRCAVAMRATRGMAKKCLVLDLDGTLWGGTVGTDGLGVALATDGIGLAYRQFQEAILELYERGVVLAINSKNNWDDALEVIDQHPAMVLRREHFAAMRINWQDKVTNLHEIAATLNLGIDSFVFLDDSPVERAWVAQQLPQVQVVELPSDPAHYRATVLQLDAFETLVLTDEDRERGRLYRQQAQAEEFRLAAGDLEAFYAGLRMRVAAAAATPQTIPRIAQLVQKTNQFNLTNRRHGAADIARMAGSPDHAVYGFSVVDRFGDNGLVGAAVVARQGRAWLVDTFVLSCRVMGRTVESAILAFLAEQARAAGAALLVGEYLPTKKNVAVRDLYATHGFVRGGDDAGRWELSLHDVSLSAPSYIELIIENSSTEAVLAQPTLG